MFLKTKCELKKDSLTTTENKVKLTKTKANKRDDFKNQPKNGGIPDKLNINKVNTV